MKIEETLKEKRRMLRFLLYYKGLKPTTPNKQSLAKTQFFYQRLFDKPKPAEMNPNRNPQNPTRIRLIRECSWMYSDSSSEESGDSAQNEYIHNPTPAPELRVRRSYSFSFSSEELEGRRDEGRQCLVGFLLNIRRFSSEFIQIYINREWELRGNATVLGRDDSKFLIHFDRDIDRRVGVRANPWAIDGAIFVMQPWNPNIPLSQARLPRIALWMQISDLPFEYQQPGVARRMALSVGDVIQID
ncbi:hypothetical protein COLO4_36354 [Corchorus olitorius]|uniref:DUF4283 domain-containing protein n=1 Tax=Corchorus olitorius TaxID=93759 RepID=A0A1R3G9J5_9ROSI|nr:hypothetical protein COLO4_36354 [Corchorus olitorius]